jgi:HTH-type transcriptional regulator, glycine betaine synthesis regulator
MLQNPTTVAQFVDAWGDLGKIWGIPRTTARIQALLLASDEPLSLDDISGRLGISKGGASDRLKQLREWEMVRRETVPGDRRDFHAAEDDVWKTFLAMVRIRKQGEFDPIAGAVRAGLTDLRRGAGKPLKARLDQMEDVLDVLDGLGDRLLAAGPAMRAVLGFIAGKRRRS